MPTSTTPVQYVHLTLVLLLRALHFITTRGRVLSIHQLRACFELWTLINPHLTCPENVRSFIEVYFVTCACIYAMHVQPRISLKQPNNIDFKVSVTKNLSSRIEKCSSGVTGNYDYLRFRTL